MKEIKAYVHANRVAVVIQALKDSQVFGGDSGAEKHNLSVYMVKSSSLALDAMEQHYSMDLGEDFINEYKLEFLCAEENVAELIAIIKKVTHTGQNTSGWIYVCDVVSAIRIN